jgi:hypothetical protein
MSPPKKYDLIVGNPPYFVMKKTHDQPITVFWRRPIYFVYHTVHTPSWTNVISFVLPRIPEPSTTTKPETAVPQFHTVYSWLRERQYIDTARLLIIKKNGSNSASTTYRITQTQTPTRYLLYQKRKKVKRPFSRRLSELGSASWSMVWNQHKDSLTDDETKTRLIYSSILMKH